METIDAPLIPAATVVLVRNGAAGQLETLLLRRNAKLNFAGGNWVFPGGRVDEADYQGNHDDSEQQLREQQRANRSTGEYQAALTAAARETSEEAGLSLDENDLVYFSHWVAPPLMKKRFSTWFFVAHIDASDGEVVIDGGEIHESRWITPGEALQQVNDQQINLLPPTIVTLHELAGFSDCDAALAHYRNREAMIFQPHTFVGEQGTDTEGQFVFLYEGDAGYESSNPAIKGQRHRLELIEGRWQYLNTV